MWAGAFGGPSPIAPGVLEFILALMEARRPEAVVGGVAVSIKVIITEVIIIHCLLFIEHVAQAGTMFRASINCLH